MNDCDSRSELYKKVADAFQGNTAHCQRGRNSYGPCILIQIVSHGETNDPQQNASWEYPPDPLRKRVSLNGFYGPSYDQRTENSILDLQGCQAISGG